MNRLSLLGALCSLLFGAAASAETHFVHPDGTGDFPTISRTLSDINRLTGDDRAANADKLANVILRDFALTGKLLKLAEGEKFEVGSVRAVVRRIGIESSPKKVVFESQGKLLRPIFVGDRLTAAFLHEKDT